MTTSGYQATEPKSSEKFPRCSVLMIQPAVQNYAWGKKNHEGHVARLWQGTQLIFSKDVHVDIIEKGMNFTVASDGVQWPLQEILARDTEYWLGDAPYQPLRPLPFLLKVLSINQALSIQSHPDRKLAAKLYAELDYPDDNHKPEMAIVLNDFEGLCGFRDPQELVQFSTDIPELAHCLGNSCAELSAAIQSQNSDAIKEALKTAYAKTFEEDDSTLSLRKNCIQAAINKKNDFPECALIERLQNQYPDDVGVLAPFFMNYLRLKPYSCLLMSENVPHAYLKGDVVECMACSDNVVRAGLTPKPKNVPVLLQMLTYAYGPPETIEPVSVAPGIQEYATERYDDFSVQQINVGVGETIEHVVSAKGPSVCLIFKGVGTVTAKDDQTHNICEGSVFLLAPGTSAVFTAFYDMQIFAAKTADGVCSSA